MERRACILLTSLLLAVASSACVGEVQLDPNDDPTDPGVDAGGLEDGGPTELDGGGVDEDGGTIDEDGGDEPEECMTPRAVFERETWPEAGKAVCAGCHLAGGVAESQGSAFLLKDESSLTSEGLSLEEFYTYNLDQFRAHADEENGMPRFLAKAMGELDHGGGAVAPQSSDAYQSLEALVTSLENEGDETCEELPPIEPIEDIELLTPGGTLRKASMMLGGTLPETAALQALDQMPEAAALAEVEVALDRVMQGQGFHDWLKYAWNDVFMFRGLWELDVTFEFQIVSPQDFRARTWGFINRGNFGCTTTWRGVPAWQAFGYPSLNSCENNRFARDYLGRRVAWSLMEGPLELIAWIVQNDRPFTEVLTSETVMMNFYSSVVYYGSARPQDNPWVAAHLDGLPYDTIEHPAGSTLAEIDLPFMHEYHPMDSVKRHQVTRPDQSQPLVWEYRQPTEYPRAGLLTDQLWLNRYPTTETNLNRHRTWAFMNQFLGIDILALADRRGDPAEAELGSDQPTIDDPNCNVCHNVMDPVAGLFQNFLDNGRWNQNIIWPRPDQPNMLDAGISVIGPNAGATWADQAQDVAPLQWLASNTIEDPRFAAQMVRHAFVQLTGHQPIEAPDNPDADGWRGRVRAYELQSEFLNELREGFVANGFDMKWVYKRIIVSPWFRARDIASGDVAANPDRLAATESFGDGDQLLTPFELHRKVEAIVQRPWQFRAWEMRGNNLQTIDDTAPANDFLLRFNSDNDFRYVDEIYRDMYGGIDFLNNTSRLHQPSSVMAATGRRISNEVACATVASEFSRTDQGLFGDVSLGAASSDDPAIRATIEELHSRMLGQVTPDSAQVDATVALYDEVLLAGQQALTDGQAVNALPQHCATPTTGGGANELTNDPTYGIRAWMAVISYLALDPAFLYQW